MGSHNMKIEEARRDYIESLAETMEMYGLSPSMGRLYGIMLFQDEPMTLDQMMDLTGMSKTSMSTGVRALSRLKLVHKKWQKGVRKDLYEAEHDQVSSFVEFFCGMWEQEIELNQRALARTEKNLNRLLADESTSPEDAQKLEADLKRLSHAKQYYHWLRNLVDVFESGEIFNHVPVPKEAD
ncbi:choline uptake/conversion transcriptional regulator CudC [Salinithrix halophila]|uniref:HTH-type transcriptional regulator n=1 Tax=Salinithrix halophila TaxID=1485204 RepID=A0ABV8JLS3_9BACL